MFHTFRYEAVRTSDSPGGCSRSLAVRIIHPHHALGTSQRFLRVNGGLVAAGRIRVGDGLETAAGVASRVTQTSREYGSGLYNPQTLDGEIVVDGILASTYTTAVAPATAHAWLAPVRLMYQMCGLYTTSFDRGADDLVKFLPRGSGVLM